MSTVGCNGEVSDRAVFGFTGAVREDSGVSVFLGELDGVEGLGEGADLVYFDEDGVRNTEIDSFWRNLELVTKRSSPTS